MVKRSESHIAINRVYWDARAEVFADAGRRNWAAEEPRWGLWGIPQSVLPVMPDDVDGKDVIELGCGTAYISAWLARRGARPVGLDNSRVQLANARAFQEHHGLRFPLYMGDAEAAPFADASFDLAISEYGASIWCDPDRWIPEAARLLRPGGQLVFMRNSTLLMLCEPDAGVASEQLLRAQSELGRFEWDDQDGHAVEFHPGHGDMVRVLRANGFVIENLIEVMAPSDATGSRQFVTPEWARRWPAEEVWFARKTDAEADAEVDEAPVTR